MACEHGVIKATCKKCVGVGICEHMHIKYTCKQCKGNSICEHNRNRFECKECKGNGICKHDKRKALCKECGGSQLCEHGTRKYDCVKCGGSMICEHKRVKFSCVKCGGKHICEHKRIRLDCMECGGLRGAAKIMFRRIKNRCKKKGYVFTLTKEDILELLGEGVCPVLGIAYDFNLHATGDASATLDKFIPSLGYTKENCIVMCGLANRIKSNATADQVHRVADWLDKMASKYVWYD